jgi:hypothetical protein
MPLLINGAPWNPSKDEARMYSAKTVWHVPPKPYDVKNERHGIGEGSTIPNRYNMRMANGAFAEVIYYTQKRWDDGLKKDFYMVGSSGESIEFNHKGKIVTNNPELNYFLTNCPYNGTNPLRESDPNHPYQGAKILFMRYKAMEIYKTKVDAAEAVTKLTALIHPSLGRNPWTVDDIRFACENINVQATFPLPYVLLHYKEHLEEENLTSLRHALLEVVMREPIKTESILLTSREAYILRLINKVLEHKDISGFHYNETERKYVIQKDGKFEDFLVVDPRKNPEKQLMHLLYDDGKKLRKIGDLHQKVLDTLEKERAVI